MDSSKVVKTVILITIAVLFLVSSIISLVSASRLISETTKTYFLGVETCTYKPVARAIAPTENYIPEKEECKVDYNNARGVLADTIAMLIVALPVAFFTYKKLFKVYRE